MRKGGGKAYRQSTLYKKAILERDGYRCQACGCGIGDMCGRHAPVVQLDVAHIIAWDHSPRSSTPSNQHVLCHSCNQMERTLKHGLPETIAQWQAKVVAWAQGS